MWRFRVNQFHEKFISKLLRSLFVIIVNQQYLAELQLLCHGSLQTYKKGNVAILEKEKKKNQKEKDLEIEEDLDVEAENIYYSIGTGVEDLLSSGLGGSFAFFNKYFPRYSKGLTGLCEENENKIKIVFTKFFKLKFLPLC